jgi:hypothetical protein
MPGLFQRFARIRYGSSSSSDDPPPRPKTAAEELASPIDDTSSPTPALRPEQAFEMSADPATGIIADHTAAAAPASITAASEGATSSESVHVADGEENPREDSDQLQVLDSAAAAAELKQAHKRAKAAAALKRMRASAGFSLWRWLPTFYDPVEDTVRSRIIGVLAVALIPAMLTGLLLEPMITDVATTVQDKAMVFSPLFLPMDPMYIGVVPAKDYAFRFVVRNSKYWPQSGKRRVPAQPRCCRSTATLPPLTLVLPLPFPPE